MYEIQFVSYCRQTLDSQQILIWHRAPDLKECLPAQCPTNCSVSVTVTSLSLMSESREDNLACFLNFLLSELFFLYS